MNFVQFAEMGSSLLVCCVMLECRCDEQSVDIFETWEFMKVS